VPKVVTETRYDNICSWPYYQPYGEYTVQVVVKRKYTKRSPVWKLKARAITRAKPKETTHEHPQQRI